ncbi:MOSC domain-containing protein [Actinokineospora guangxiensis]|uniref:MOSC domain-containing protein n=1 Tax=Actinokineospora guangxiensis TaxID=1490288 RepID=A0ABW0EQ13_9PSEU
MGTVVEIFSYPVKGCAGVSLTRADVTPAGLRHDREFMVTGLDGVFRSQRRSPRLALIRPEVVGDVLLLRATGVEEQAIPIHPDGPRRPVTLFSAPFTAVDQGDAAAGWLSEVLGAPSRLVRVPPDHARVVDGATPGTSGWADSAAVHLLTRSSLADLAARVDEPLPLSRFRPNIVVDDLGAPYAEDDLRAVRIGSVGLAFCKHAIRCAVTLVDQDTGVRAGPEPLRALAAYRRHPDGGVAFGTKFSVVAPGALAVGDVVSRTCREAPPAGSASR